MIPRRRSPRRWHALGGVVVLLLAPAGQAAPADGGAAPAAGSPSADRARAAAAEAAFRGALTAYEEGRYADAEAELQRALALDPRSKDLLFNLALVQEKRGRLREAVVTLDRLIPLETDGDERASLERTRRRLVGAQREQPAAPAGPPAAADPPSRTSGWVIAGVTTAIAATAVGTYFGWRALSEQPSASSATGAAVSAAELRERHASAHRSAVLADIAFAVALVSGGTALVLRATTPAAPGAAGSAVHASWRGRF